MRRRAGVLAVIALASLLAAAAPLGAAGPEGWEHAALRHLPVLRFAAGEDTFPTSFYFDQNTDVHDNAAAYDPRARGQLYVHHGPPVEASPAGAPAAGAVRFVVLQYWHYYVTNLGGPSPLRVYPDHPHDWDTVVQLWFDARAGPGAPPLFARVSAHGYFGPPVAWAAVPREGPHPVVEVALGDHAGGFAGVIPGELPHAVGGQGRVLRAGDLDVAFVGHASASTEVGGVVYDAVGWRGSHPAWDAFSGRWWPVAFDPLAGDAPWRRAVWNEPWREALGSCPAPLPACPAALPG